MNNNRILVVDDEELILDIIDNLLGGTYNITLCTCIAEAKKELLNDSFATAILDINLKDKMTGIDFMKYIKANHTRTEVIIMTGFAQVQTSIDAFRFGAIDYLIKPFSSTELSTAVSKAFERRWLQFETTNLQETIQLLAETAKQRDPYTTIHQERVAGLVMLIGKELMLTEKDLKRLKFACLIHDIGKIYIPTDILNKPGKLNKAEMELIRMHPATGHTIVSKIKSAQDIAEIVLQHHELIDGSGYPNGIKGDELTRGARILVVADVIEAVASHRPYRPALGLPAGMKIIEKGKGIIYDSDVVNACINLCNKHGNNLISPSPEQFEEIV